MKGLFERQEFPGLGPTRYGCNAQLPTLTLVEASRPGRLRIRVRQECPRGPGVYGMLSNKGELIYVGKSKNLRSRLLSYFRPRSRDSRASRIVEHTRALVWEPGPHEFGALLRELELIRRWRPRFNVQGQPLAKRRLYVCVGRQPAPYCFLSGRPPTTTTALFGPVPAGIRAREAVRRLNDWYRLRDCPQSQVMAFADQAELFPVVRSAGCLRHELGNCLAPCASACTRRDYRGNVRALLDFLAGKDRQPIDMLTREMNEAAVAQQYERAAALRDQLDRLVWMDQMLERARTAAVQSFVYPVRNPVGGELWYLIERGRVRRVLPRPNDDAQRQLALKVLGEVYRASDHPDPLTIEEMDSVLLVAGWFRKFPAERERSLSPTVARALLTQEPEA